MLINPIGQTSRYGSIATCIWAGGLSIGLGLVDNREGRRVSSRKIWGLVPAILILDTHRKMVNDSSTSDKINPKKTNLLDHHSIKHILDESVTEVVKYRGYVEDVRLSNVRLLMGTIIIIIALVAQFYPSKFPENWNFLISCIILYVVFSCLLQLIIYTKEKDAILFTYPPPGAFNITGLVVTSKLPRFSDMYTLTIESTDPKSVSANKPVELTKSVTRWFTKDGVLVEGLFWKDVEGLIDGYNKEPRKNK